MPLRALAGPQDPMSEAISKFQRVLGWMKDFSKPRMVAGKELRTISRPDFEHGAIPFRHRTALNEEGTVPWGGSLRSSSPSARPAPVSPPGTPAC